MGKVRISKKYSLDVIKFIKLILFSLLTIFVVWNVVSYIDIMLYQLRGGTDHPWNIFLLIDNITK